MRKKAKAKEARKYTNEKQVKKEKVVRKLFVNNVLVVVISMATTRSLYLTL